MTSQNFQNIPDGPAPAAVLNATGPGPFLLVCEHASNHIPPAYANLGLDVAARDSHIAWDPGAFSVASALAQHLASPLVFSTVSRLVYDCNRPPTADGAMPSTSEKFDVPGNVGLTDTARAQRTKEVYLPFQTCMAQTIKAAKHPPVIVTIHSFTKTYLDKPRAVELGILHDRDTALADQILALAPRHTDLVVQRNAPYGPEHGVTHTLKEHGLKNGLQNVMLEIRNDLITTQQEQTDMAKMLAGLLQDALADMATSTTRDTQNAKTS